MNNKIYPIAEAHCNQAPITGKHFYCPKAFYCLFINHGSVVAFFMQFHFV